jgi:CRP/FNR family transcriptional regulator, anaerobic regulatory protein
MAESSLYTLLSSLTDLSAELKDQLKRYVTHERYHHHQVFQVNGQVPHRIWFLEEGLVREYYYDRSGKEHTLHFYSNSEMIFSWFGWYKEPADFYLEALESCKLSSISYDTVQRLQDEFKEMRLILETFAHHRYQQEAFYMRMLTLSADDRYRQYRNVNPTIFRRVSIKLIATYLNMTRENLSKLITNDTR